MNNSKVAGDSKVVASLNKGVVYAIWGVLALSLIFTYRGCSAAKENVRLRKEFVDLKNSVDSLQKNINEQVYNKVELDTRMEILGLEVSKRMLYDQNAIVRTAVRPDDKMNEYDQKIKELRKKLR
jgi:hypothetical protein